MTDTLLTVLCEANVSCTDLPYQPGATIVSPILLSLSGVAGQIWALYYLYTSTRPQHSRTVFFILLSTLIWTDLAGKVITTTPALVAYLHNTWAGGVPLCNLHGFSMMLVSLVTHLLVSTMALERFLGIRHGYFYNKNITTSRTKMLLLCMWLFSVMFCALPLFGVGQYALQYPGSWCYVNIHITSDSPLIHRLYTNVFGVFTLISLIVMVVCNVVVITTLLSLRLCRGRCGSHSLCIPRRSSRQRELEMQMVVVLVVITVVFVLSWSPIDIRLFANQLWPHKTRQEHFHDLVAVRLTSVNQIVDPWAYIICRKVFMMRAWRWLRVSLLGSRLVVGRSSTNQGPQSPSNTKLVVAPLTVRPSLKKIQYPLPFTDEKDPEDLGRRPPRGVSVVIEVSGRGEAVLHLTSPPALASKDHLKRELDAKEVLKVLLDSGSPSNITPSSRCSDSGLAAVNNSPYHGSTVEPGSQALVPIPVFTCQQYRVEALGEPRPQLRPLPRPLPRLKRITSSASARNAPASPRPRSQALPLDGVGPASSVSTVVFGRRHSWCCSRDVDDTKQYRSQSTQTFRDQEVPPLPDACLSNPETEILKVRGELAIPDFYCSHSSAQIRKEHEVSIPDGYCSHHETQVLKDNGTLAIPVSCCGRHDTGTLKDHSGLTIHDSCYSQSSTQILKENGGMSVLDTCCNHPSYHACSQHHPQHNDTPQQYEEHDQTHCHLDEDDSVFIIAND